MVSHAHSHLYRILEHLRALSTRCHALRKSKRNPVTFTYLLLIRIVEPSWNIVDCALLGRSCWMHHKVSSSSFNVVVCFVRNACIKDLTQGPCPFIAPLTPFLIAPNFSRLVFTAPASTARTSSVSSQPIQASVIETPYLSPFLPSGGTF